QIDEGETAVLVFFGDGDDEAKVSLHQLLERILVTRADLAGKIDFLRSFEERIGGHLVEVLVEDVAFGFVRRDPSGGRATATTLEFGHVTVSPRTQVCVGVRIYGVSGGPQTGGTASLLSMNQRERRRV